MIDNEEMIVNYEAEEAEAMIDIADMALEQLILESIEGLAKAEKAKGVSR